MQEENSATQNFSERLRVALRHGGLESPLDLSRKLEVAPSSVYRWFEGSVPRRRQIREIAKSLRVAEAWLKDGIGDIAPPEEPIRQRDTVHLPYETDRISEDAPDATTDVATAAHSMTTAELVTALHDMIDGLAGEKYSFLRPQRAATIRALLAELTKRE